MATIEQHLKMMRTPGDWPRWPVLPLKRPTDPDQTRPDTGVLLAHADHLTTVFFVNIWELRGCRTLGDIIEQANGSKVYPDHEGIVDDGWTVD